MVANIIVKGAREHNLKNISVTIPRDKIVVFTGLSGSGKSTLAFDTIYAEGQRRYVESLSAYARQFLELMDKPDVDSIDGLSPAISIQQKTTNKNPRSTVGTVTEIYDYLRLLYARIGIPFCPKCERRISRQSTEAISDSIIISFEARTGILLAPLVREKKGSFGKLLEGLKKDGFPRVRVDGVLTNLDSYSNSNRIGGNVGRESNWPILDKQKKHSIEVVVDRLEISKEERARIIESVQLALRLGKGLAAMLADNELHLYSQQNACPKCGLSMAELEPRSFSFNSPFGACNACNGLGFKLKFDPDLIIPDRSKSILEGAIKPWLGRFASFRSSKLRDVGKHFGFNLNLPISKFTEDQLKVILYGTDRRIRYIYRSRNSDSKWEYIGNFEGVIPNLERLYGQTESDSKREEIAKYMREHLCEFCGGKRLRKEALAVKIDGKSIIDVCNLSIWDCLEFFNQITLSTNDLIISRTILKEIRARLQFLLDVGLDYLQLNRTVSTLSGGESQRIRLATQIGSNLSGVLYVLDEPTIGLHQRDNAKLIATLEKLRALGNSLIIVEHDEEVIRSSDWVLDLGPGAGNHGGKIVACGNVEDVSRSVESVTGQYLSGALLVTRPKDRRRGANKFITVLRAEENNLKSIDVSFPLGCLTLVTGVSGSGKSTLVNDILFKGLSAHFYNSRERVGKHKAITGLEMVDKVIGIDQSPIGRTPRSNPATYVNAFTPIRELFSKTPMAKEKGFKLGRFSFNVPDGRCEECEGAGVKRIEMQFLADVYVTCDSCKGKRYNSETLTISFKKKTVADILAMTVDEALDFFSNIPSVYRKLVFLSNVGLGYIRLGQPATTLSGGESQRIKLAAELSKKDTGNTVYILDEPTTGLHFADVSKLLYVMQRLVNLGNTVIIIEHNLDVIASADWIIDLGPEGGQLGGMIVAVGTPEEISRIDRSHTGKYLKSKLFPNQVLNTMITEQDARK
ncbi:MAG: excinuclease ABC subunit UvrA [Nitrososphaeraceae archaeon]|jgi:excinuclease ABC subunit A